MPCIQKSVILTFLKGLFTLYYSIPPPPSFPKSWFPHELSHDTENQRNIMHVQHSFLCYLNPEKTQFAVPLTWKTHGSKFGAVYQQTVLFFAIFMGES